MKLFTILFTLLLSCVLVFASESRYIIVFSKGLDTPSKIVDNVEKKLIDLGVKITYKYNTIIRGFAITMNSDKVSALDDFNDKDFPFFVEADQTVTINE